MGYRSERDAARRLLQMAAASTDQQLRDDVEAVAGMLLNDDEIEAALLSADAEKEAQNG